LSVTTQTEPVPKTAAPPPAERLGVLFTEGASLSARQSLYPLGGGHQIDVCDPDILAQCRFSRLVRRRFLSPSFNKKPEQFLRFLADKIRKHRYDVLLPTHEQVYLLSRFRDAFTPHVGLALPDFSAMERLQNKAEFSRLLCELDLPQPESVFVRTREELDREWKYPFYLKLAHSTAGGGVFHVESRDQLLILTNGLINDGRLNGHSEAIVQQPACGVLSTVQAVFDHGRLVGIHSFEARRLGVGGMSTARTSADHPLVREQIEKLGSYVGWHGALFIDYFYDRERGRPEYIEANPRVGETVNAWLSGTNLAELLVRVSRGESPPPAPLGRIGVRTHNLFMILMSAAFFGEGRRALLNELRDWRAGRGLYENGQDELTRFRDDPVSIVPAIWVITQLLIWPRRARGIVESTVKNYSLPESETETIKKLPLDLLSDAW
jgi:predicted ATP-grasp superfamily ATP-dependent carboligase